MTNIMTVIIRGVPKGYDPQEVSGRVVWLLSTCDQSNQLGTLENLQNDTNIVKFGQ